MAKGKKQNLSAEELLKQALVPEDEQPYELPANWVWTKAKNGFEITSSKRVHKHEWRSSGVPFYRTRELVVLSEKGYVENELFIDKELYREYKKTFGTPKVNDLLISGVGTIGVPYVVTNEDEFYFKDGNIIWFQNKGLFEAAYMFYLYKSLFMRNQLKEFSSGTTVDTYTIVNAKQTKIPLPPLAEQRRIVNRIESLFDKLDQAKELAQKALDSFETRKTAILHKAFKGELTAGWREEHTFESAQNRLMNIINTRSDIGSKSKELVAYMDELAIEEVSDSNGWLHLKAMLICDNITCGGTPTGFIYEHDEIPFLKVYNIVDNKIAFAEKPQFTNRETHEGQLKSSKLKPDDVVMNIVGPPLRKVAVIPEEYAEWNMNQAIVRFRTLEHVLPKFLYYCLVYPATLDEVISDTKGVVGQANISITQSRNLIIPVPSLEEQHEIVNILDSFFDKEQKAKELGTVVDKIDLMKKAILSRAFRGELGTNDPNEESALDLLKEVISAQL